VGAESFYGLEGNVYRNDFTGVKFVTNDGEVYYTEVLRNEKTGNLFFTLSGITLPPIEMYQYMTTLSGNFYVVTTDGTEVKINFDWRAPSCSWYISSSTDGLYQSFNEETGDVEIEYYPPYEPIEY
jgi:hypothetical protein